MGTNYYWVDGSDACDHCGRGETRTHIGKSSVGWCFSLHVYPDGVTIGEDEVLIHSLEGWKSLIESRAGFILNEDHEKITPTSLFGVIEKRSRIEKASPSKHDDPYSAPGPNNLRRHKINPQHGCIGHGAGTWDLLVGEFF